MQLHCGSLKTALDLIELSETDCIAEGIRLIAYQTQQLIIIEQKKSALTICFQ